MKVLVPSLPPPPPKKKLFLVLSNICNIIHKRNEKSESDHGCSFNWFKGFFDVPETPLEPTQDMLPFRRNCTSNQLTKVFLPKLVS